MRPKIIDRVPPPWRAPLLKLGFNLHPAYRATGGRVVSVARDLKHIRVKLPCNWRTRNIAGTLFGGSLYAVTDPMFAMLLALNLEPGVIIWDKGAAIRYRRPGLHTLYADFYIDDAEVAAVWADLQAHGETERTYRVELKDRQGVVHVEVEKTVYLARKAYYKAKLANRSVAPVEAGTPGPGAGHVSGA